MGNIIKDRIGEIINCPKRGKIKIIEYFSNIDCTIQFEDGYILKNVRYDNLKRNVVRNPMQPSYFNVGYVGKGGYYTKGGLFENKCANLWTNLLRRCYALNRTNKNKKYIDVVMCKEWHNFQNFAQWFYENYRPENMKGWHLDKDILVKNNKIYSPETCCFVPAEINTLFTVRSIKSNNTNGVYKVGKKFKAVISIEGKRVSLGTFDTEYEAYCTYKKAKELRFKEVGYKWRDQIDSRVFQIMNNYKIAEYEEN